MKRGVQLVALGGAVVSAAVAAALVGSIGPSSATASSHREAPLIADDPAADNTDVYAFVSPDKPNTATTTAPAPMRAYRTTTSSIRPSSTR